MRMVEDPGKLLQRVAAVRQSPHAAAASNGNGEASWRAKWCTRKYAPSAPSSSAATASSIDCSSASEAERVFDCGDGVQCPNDRNPIFFMPASNTGNPPLTSPGTPP